MSNSSGGVSDSVHEDVTDISTEDVSDSDEGVSDRDIDVSDSTEVVPDQC